jgi:HSP20 family protein
MELIKRNDPRVPDAWKDLQNLQREINALFQDDFFPASAGLFDRTYSPAVDVVENDEHYLVSCEVPGMSESDIDVQLADNVLTIKGTKKEKEEESDKRWFKRETWYGSFQRTIPLPAGIESDKIEAVLENGMLMLTLPKKEEVKPKQISVRVK